MLIPIKLSFINKPYLLNLIKGGSGFGGSSTSSPIEPNREELRLSRAQAANICRQASHILSTAAHVCNLAANYLDPQVSQSSS
jgi:hypothetical protein